MTILYTQINAARDKARSYLRHTRRRWGRVPVIFKLQLACVFSMLVMTYTVSQVLAPQGYHTVAFAIPAAEQSGQRWDTEVDAFGYRLSAAFGVHHTTAQEFAPWILEASERQMMEPELLASLVLTESSFRKHVRSHIGAVGPTQVRPEYWSKFCGSSDLHVDPAENIYCGAQVLSHLTERCGGTTCGLHAYNVGVHSDRLKAGQRYVNKVDGYAKPAPHPASLTTGIDLYCPTAQGVRVQWASGSTVLPEIRVG